jgi:predicted nucleotide-binding protein
MEIFLKLNDKYNNSYKNKICIIDVDDKYKGLNDYLCEGILQEINKCNMFICILTPINSNDGTIIINNNVILELGYAYSCIDKENIFIFIEEDENKKNDFERFIPSMLASIKYNTYITYEDVDYLSRSKNLSGSLDELPKPKFTRSVKGKPY